MEELLNMTAMQRVKTNVEFVTEMMNFSSAGPLMQIFVLHALETYAAHVVAHADEVEGNPMISAESWVACAKEVETWLRSRATGEMQVLTIPEDE